MRYIGHLVTSIACTAKCVGFTVHRHIACDMRCGGTLPWVLVQSDTSDSRKTVVPYALPGQCIRALAFVRFEDTLSVFEESSALTLSRVSRDEQNAFYGVRCGGLPPLFPIDCNVEASHST